MINRFKFKDMLYDYWDTLNWRILDYTQKTGSGINTSQYQYNLMQWVNKFGDGLRSVYGTDNKESINTYLNGILIGLFQAVYLIENNVDTDQLTGQIVAGPITELDGLMSKLNPAWGGEVVKGVFISLWNSWLNEARFQLAGDAAKVNDYFKESKATSDAFITVFYNGIMEQFPEFFTDRSI